MKYDPATACYCGKRVTDMTREELADALCRVSQLYDESLKESMQAVRALSRRDK